jgi:ABC-type multidrug transport system ATPase subunit
MDEAARCDRIAFLHNGRILSVNTPSAICDSFPYSLLRVRCSDMYKALVELRTAPFARSCYAFGDAHHVGVEPNVTPGVVTEWLRAAGHTAIEVESIPAGIEDTFMQLSEGAAHE